MIVKTDGSFAALGNTGGGGCRGAHYSVCRDEEDQQPCSSPPADICQQDLDPTHFAPTGDIYSYFQRRRRDPFHFANPLQHSVKNRLGGRHGKYFVYWIILLSRRNKTNSFSTWNHLFYAFKHNIKLSASSVKIYFVSLLHGSSRESVEVKFMEVWRQYCYYRFLVKYAILTELQRNFCFEKNCKKLFWPSWACAVDIKWWLILYLH